MVADRAVAVKQRRVAARLRRKPGSSLTQEVLRWTCIALLLGLIGVPVATLVYGSLRDAAPGVPGAFTWSNYEILAHSEMAGLIKNTLIVAIGSALVAVILGFTLAFIIVRTNVPGAKFFDTVVLIPAYVSPFIAGLAWIALLSPKVGYISQVLKAAGLGTLNIFSLGGMIWVIGSFYAPLAYLYIRPAMLNFDTSLEEAARVTGAGRFTTMRRIVVPLVMPAVFSAGLVVAVQAAGLFGVPAELGSSEGIYVLPTALVQRISQFPPEPNQAAVLGIALTLLTIIGLGLNSLLTRRKEYVIGSGRGATRTRIQLGRGRYACAGFCWVYLLIMVVLPVAAMVVGSLQPFLSPTTLFETKWTLKNYRYIFSFPPVVSSIGNSVELAIGAAICGTVLAVLLCYFLARTKRFGNAAIEQLVAAPIAIPHTVLGLAFLWAWVSIPIGVYGTKWILLMVYTVLFFPLAVRAILPAFTQLAGELEEAGRTLGASWLLTMRRITVPLLRPALISAAIIILYHSVRELSASVLLTSANSNVMGVAMYQLQNDGYYGQVLALGLVNIAITMAMVGALGYTAKTLESRTYRGSNRRRSLVAEPEPVREELHV